MVVTWKVACLMFGSSMYLGWESSAIGTLRIVPQLCYEDDLVPASRRLARRCNNWWVPSTGNAYEKELHNAEL